MADVVLRTGEATPSDVRLRNGLADVVGTASTTQAAQAAAVDGSEWTIPLDGRTVPQILDSVGRLAGRPEFGAVRAKVLDLCAAFPVYP